MFCMVLLEAWVISLLRMCWLQVQESYGLTLAMKSTEFASRGMTFLGDVNGDLAPDFAVSDFKGGGYGVYEGSNIYVYFGSTDGTLDWDSAEADVIFTGTIEDTEIDEIALLGDVTGDGNPDFGISSAKAPDQAWIFSDFTPGVYTYDGLRLKS